MDRDEWKSRIFNRRFSVPNTTNKHKAKLSERQIKRLMTSAKSRIKQEQYGAKPRSNTKKR